MQIFFEPDYEGAGPRLIVLARNRWPGYLRRYCGIHSQPLFERESLPHEVDVFPNGHPFAWAYRTAKDLLADEARWLSPLALRDLAVAIDQAVAAAGLAPLGIESGVLAGALAAASTGLIQSRPHA